jgi:very-short-patch-repair endonuclease
MAAPTEISFAVDRRVAEERDRERDAALARAGHRVLRFTHRQLADDPHAVAATIAVALA